MASADLEHIQRGDMALAEPATPRAASAATAVAENPVPRVVHPPPPPPEVATPEPTSWLRARR
ncbi:MAG: hypothetical protein ABI867_45345 [Kofleriaceae bacterium]